MARGSSVFVPPCVDWFSRRGLAWRLSITLAADLCVEALEEALARHGRPEIFNTDQGISSAARLHRGAEERRNRGQHGRQGRLARQRLRRAALADDQVRGGLPQSLRRRSASPRFDWPLLASTTARGPIPRLAGKLPSRHISTWRRQSRRQPEVGGRSHSETPKTGVQTNRATFWLGVSFGGAAGWRAAARRCQSTKRSAMVARRGGAVPAGAV